MSAPVTGGTPEPGLPAVVALVDGNGVTGCTATLIEDHTLLTAAHCVATLDLHAIRACFGAEVADATCVDLAAVRLHPEYDTTLLTHDLALITIRGDAPTAPLALDARTVDASWVGATFEVAGYGVTEGAAGDAGVLRVGTAQVSEVAMFDLTVVPAPSLPCTGDAGGPALFDDGGALVVTGVASHGDGACADHAFYAHVDVARDFIDDYLADTAPGTAATGDACLYDGHCAAGACLQAADDATLWFCGEACDHDDDCPATMACVDDQCRYPLPSPGALGSTCELPRDCTSRVCHDGACSLDCADAVCPTGYACEDAFCVAAPPTGCCATGGGGTTAVAAILVLALALRTDRRRRCRAGRAPRTDRRPARGP